MRRSSKELSKDPNQLAYEIVRLSTEEKQREKDSISKYLAKIGHKGGLKGGKSSAAKLSKERRTEITKNAAESRWKSKRKS